MLALVLGGADCGWETGSGGEQEIETTTVSAAAPQMYTLAVELVGHHGTHVSGELSVHFERDDVPPSAAVTVRLHCEASPWSDRGLDLEAQVRSEWSSAGAFTEELGLGFTSDVPAVFACDFIVEAPELTVPYTFTWNAFAGGEWNGGDDDAAIDLIVTPASP